MFALWRSNEAIPKKASGVCMSEKKLRKVFALWRYVNVKMWTTIARKAIQLDVLHLTVKRLPSRVMMTGKLTEGILIKSLICIRAFN